MNGAVVLAHRSGGCARPSFSLAETSDSWEEGGTAAWRNTPLLTGTKRSRIAYLECTRKQWRVATSPGVLFLRPARQKRSSESARASLESSPLNAGTRLFRGKDGLNGGGTSERNFVQKCREFRQRVSELFRPIFPKGCLRFSEVVSNGCGLCCAQFVNSKMLLTAVSGAAAGPHPLLCSPELFCQSDCLMELSERRNKRQECA